MRVMEEDRMRMNECDSLHRCVAVVVCIRV